MSQTRRIFCFFHMDGELVKDSDMRMHYEGGRTVGRMINEGTSLVQLLSIIGECMKEPVEAKQLKYTVKFEPCELLDLVDDVGVTQLIWYNEQCGHVYIFNRERSIGTSQQSEWYDLN